MHQHLECIVAFCRKWRNVTPNSVTLRLLFADEAGAIQFKTARRMQFVDRNLVSDYHSYSSLTRTIFTVPIPHIRQMAAVADNKHQQSGDEVANHYLHSWICISVSVLKILRKIFPHIKAGISQSTKATNEYATFMAGSGIHRLHWSTMHRSILRNHKGINSRIQTFIQATYQEMR